MGLSVPEKILASHSSASVVKPGDLVITKIDFFEQVEKSPPSMTRLMGSLECPL
jgi:hypothetical protein